MDINKEIIRIAKEVIAIRTEKIPDGWRLLPGVSKIQAGDKIQRIGPKWGPQPWVDVELRDPNIGHLVSESKYQVIRKK